MMKFFGYFILTYIFFTTILTAQIIEPTWFSYQSPEQNYNESFILGLPNNDIMLFWYDSLEIEIKSARSIDNGNSWIDENTIYSFTSSPQFRTDINAIVLNSGRVLLTYRTGEYKFIYSDDNCNNWSEPASLPTRPTAVGRLRVYWSSLGKTSNGSAVFVHSYAAYSNHQYNAKGIFTLTSSDGSDWFALDTVDVNGGNGNLVNIGNSKDLIVYHDSTENSDDIFFRLSTDSGLSWSEKTLLIGGINSQKNVRGIKDQSGKIWIFFEDEEPTPFDSLTQQDINFITSTDEGNSWSSKQKFTSYKGIDKNFSLSTWNGKPVLSFTSSRAFSYLFNKLQIYYGIGGETIDTNGPPYLFYHSVQPEFINEFDPVTFRAWVLDDNEIDSVLVVIKENENAPIEYLMYDDGLHNDSLPNDNIYAYVFQNGFSNGDIIDYDFYLTDAGGNNSYFKGSYTTIPSITPLKEYLLEVNKLKLPLNNRGVLAQVNINGQDRMEFEESTILFSGGFFISGLNEQTAWAAGQATSALAENFIPGAVGTDPINIKNSIYSIKKTDPDFGTSWQQYRFAVQSGADFYDGNNDSAYNPLDLNSNGLWDTNEDKPDMFGDETVWCLYNDGQPANQRTRFQGVAPQGIDIQQTIFQINENLNPIQNMFFVRYRIINKGTVSENLSDVYFTIWSDPDIGLEYGDELVGSDTLLNLGYCYNDSLDNNYGSNPPAIGTTILQGPAVYIVGETFIDNNGDEIFSLGIDTPLDSALINNGHNGITVLPGAKNLGMTSFYYTDCGNPVTGEPNNVEQARTVMRGQNIIGEFTDPCNWSQGMVIGVPCSEVNPIYHYSGDPVAPYGWIHVTPCDMRMWTNIGPFELPANEKVDIWAAYIVGRGNDNLNSVTKLKEYTSAAHNFYKSNFTQLPVSVENEIQNVVDYNLYQNYPNPFNPTTTIRYTIPQEGRVTIKIFDILGQEVSTLKNGFQKANKYEINFNAASIASGVYIYRLQVNDFTLSKKMMVLK